MSSDPTSGIKMRLVTDNDTQHWMQTYCSPIASCTGHLWSYSVLRNNDPEDEEHDADIKGGTVFLEAKPKRARPYLTGLAHVAVQFVDIMRTLQGEGRGGDQWRSKIWPTCTQVRCLFFVTWLESPVQVSAMSQSLTVSRHVTPRSSYCHHHADRG